MKTIRGIYHNLEESEYIFSRNHITFYFSSQLYLNKFVRIYDSEVDRFNDNGNSMYKDKFNLVLDDLALIRLYAIIEKRGFYIKVNEEIITCLNDIIFELVTKTVSCLKN
jgi:hypothetical protein